MEGLLKQTSIRSPHGQVELVLSPAILRADLGRVDLHGRPRLDVTGEEHRLEVPDATILVVNATQAGIVHPSRDLRPRRNVLQRNDSDEKPVILADEHGRVNHEQRIGVSGNPAGCRGLLAADDRSGEEWNCLHGLVEVPGIDGRLVYGSRLSESHRRVQPEAERDGEYEHRDAQRVAS